MHSILDVPEIRADVHRWTVADYRALAEDQPGYEHSELIRGIIVEKEMKTFSHDYLTGSIAEWLRGVVSAGMHVRQEASLLLADSVPGPDVAVVREGRVDFRGRHPTTAALIVEVAVTSLAVDREKAAIYAEAGQMEAYRRPEAGAYRERRTCWRGETIEGVEVVGGGAVAVDTLFA